jgi:ABC-type multidrug transport system fused ATPase/permease subunit
MVFEAGRVIEQGSFDELVALRGRFSELVAMQLPGGLITQAAE